MTARISASPHSSRHSQMPSVPAKALEGFKIGTYQPGMFDDYIGFGGNVKVGSQTYDVQLKFDPEVTVAFKPFEDAAWPKARAATKGEAKALAEALRDNRDEHHPDVQARINVAIEALEEI
jgi:hypothetical protein